jgi:DEAD/DEAH box helicase
VLVFNACDGCRHFARARPLVGHLHANKTDTLLTHQQLTDDDVVWSDGDADAPPPPPEAQAAAVKAATVLAESAERAAGVVAGLKKDKMVEKKGKEVKTQPKIAPSTPPKPKLSTSVGALLPAHGQAAGTSAPDLAPDGAEVLAGLPPAVRRVAVDVFKLAGPTRVQAVAWPPAASGRDVLMLAPPGAGKTLAYLVPVAAEALASERRSSKPSSDASSSTPSSIILVPTRELARQVYRDAAPLRATLRCACIYGGASRDDQVDRLAGGGVKLLVATPGRLLDLVEGGVVGLGKFWVCGWRPSSR